MRKSLLLVLPMLTGLLVGASDLRMMMTVWVIE